MVEQCSICGSDFERSKKTQRTCGAPKCSRASWENRNVEQYREAVRVRLNRRYREDPAFRERHKRSARLTRYKKWGINNPEEAVRIFEAATFCVVCLRTKDEVKLHLHHDHATGDVLGVLCEDDNLADGKAGSDAGRLLRLAALRMRMPLDNLRLESYGTSGTTA